jgi:hypothetical protein
MPRAPVKLAQSREPIPDWWADHFFKRQSTCRNLILRGIKRAGRPLCCSEIKQLVTSFWACETDHALSRLHDDGILSRRVREEPLSRFGYGTGTRTYTYYDLAERHPEEA